MSRIDEALKRASFGATGQRREPAAFPSPARPADESLLDQYPREGRSSPSRGEPVAPFVRDEHAAPVERPGGELAVARPIPVVHSRPKAQDRPVPVVPSFDSKLVLGGDASPMLVEQYRRLAASMHELQMERGVRTLTVTSAVPREGKSLTVANLALTLSESYGRRVLLIDADLRRPSIHELFGLSNEVGLVDVLRSGGTDVPVLRVTPLLSVLPAGLRDTNPVGGITSDRMRALLDEAAAQFDWVLLDAPPVAIMPDAALLAGMTRATVLVIAAGSTSYVQVARAIEEIGRESIVGTVLNRIDDRNIPETSFYRAYHETPTPAV